MYYSTIHSYRWIVLFCAVILGRYYTDAHNVDEDIDTISSLGGHWNSWTESKHPGAMIRSLEYSPVVTFDIVASLSMKKLIKYYADSHDVDEDQATMTAQGGHWVHEGNTGVACRAASDNPSITLGIIVASKKK